MHNLDSPPTGYAHFKKLTICSNILLDGGVLLALDGDVPLWIGRGSNPRIWLSAASHSQKTLQIINNSKPAISNINKQESGREISFDLNGQRIITAKTISKEEGEVTFLDLRPIGFLIHGDQESLVVGSSKFTRNTFMGSKSVFSISNESMR